MGGPMPTLAPFADIDWSLIVLFFLLFGGGGIVLEVIKNMNNTRLEIARLNAQKRDTEGVGQEVTAVREELAALRTQVTELRDTTMQYDLSFDTALQRLERRVEQVEQQQHIRS
jgi:hypothetical protein